MLRCDFVTGPMRRVDEKFEFREADARACRDIGVTRERGATMMARLWGRTFTEERDGRAGPDANAQRRGQISRALKTELAKGK